jgi:hypothetical protein
VSTDDKDLIDEGLRTLSDGEAQAEAAEHAALEELAQRVEEPGLQDKILDRYMSFGRDLLSDQLPSHLDPRIIKRLEPILGDMSAVRVHTGATATAAARAMDARAFALGDRDIFIDTQQFDPTSRRGSALIAHELAHARDASTGFALSSKQGSQTSDREAFAEAVESRVFAMEDDSLEGAAKSIESVAAPNDPANRAESTVDKEALSRRVWEILEAQQRSGRDRHGR